MVEIALGPDTKSKKYWLRFHFLPQKGAIHLILGPHKINSGGEIIPPYLSFGFRNWEELKGWSIAQANLRPRARRKMVRIFGLTISLNLSGIRSPIRRFKERYLWYRIVTTQIDIFGPDGTLRTTVSRSPSGREKIQEYVRSEHYASRDTWVNGAIDQAETWVCGPDKQWTHDLKRFNPKRYESWTEINLSSPPDLPVRYFC